LKLEAKLESASSYFTFKRLVPASRRFQHGYHPFNLHCPYQELSRHDLDVVDGGLEALGPGVYTRPLLGST
jgi:hypothetical protein